MARRTFAFTRRDVLTASGTALAGGLAGCSGESDGGSQFDDSDPLLTHDRWGKGETALSYRTSDFYTPIEEESSQPAATPALRTQHEEWAEAHPDYRIDVGPPGTPSTAEFPASWFDCNDHALDVRVGPKGSVESGVIQTTAGCG